MKNQILKTVQQISVLASQAQSIEYKRLAHRATHLLNQHNITPPPNLQQKFRQALSSKWEVAKRKYGDIFDLNMGGFIITLNIASDTIACAHEDLAELGVFALALTEQGCYNIVITPYTCSDSSIAFYNLNAVLPQNNKQQLKG